MRKPRHLLNGAGYHVTARINRQEFALQPPEIKELFIAVLRQSKTKFNFTLRNFVLMSTHIHLQITPGAKENLSKIMQWILSVFAIRFNKLMGYKGHVWYDRFKSSIIHNYRIFLQTFYYIANNPVKAGLVKRPEDFAYSGVSFLIRGIYDIIHPPDLSIMVLPLKSTDS